MKLANATNTNRKFGKPRDLPCASPERNCRYESLLSSRLRPVGVRFRMSEQERRP
jgi:hypothetical protein